MIAWTLFEHDQRGGPKLPSTEETPWTHGGPPAVEGRGPGAVPLPEARTPADETPAPPLPLPDPVTEDDFL